jgi:hypothetical protein
MHGRNTARLIVIVASDNHDAVVYCALDATGMLLVLIEGAFWLPLTIR